MIECQNCWRIGFWQSSPKIIAKEIYFSIFFISCCQKDQNVLVSCKTSVSHVYKKRYKRKRHTFMLIRAEFLLSLPVQITKDKITHLIVMLESAFYQSSFSLSILSLPFPSPCPFQLLFPLSSRSLFLSPVMPLLLSLLFSYFTLAMAFLLIYD